jgi:hypothetical protein
MKTVVARIRKLENRYVAVIQALRKDDGPSEAEVIAVIPARVGVVRGPHESLAETAARATGISVREFRAELQRRAAGIRT